MIEEDQIFTKDERAQNDIRKNSLLKLINSGESILIAGAGASAGLYPSWKKLLINLGKEATDRDPNFKPYSENEDYLDFADRVKKSLGSDIYYSYISKVFEPSTPTHESFHETLCRLPFKAIATTNYDRVLENAMLAVESERDAPKFTLSGDNSICIGGMEIRILNEFLLSLNYNTKKQKKILHLHGIYNITDSIILCREEYYSKYGFVLKIPAKTLYEEIKNDTMSEESLQKLLFDRGYQWPIHRKLLWSLLATRRVVFMGFSLTDPYFTKMLDFVSSDLHTYFSETHFLIIRVNKENKEKTFEFGRQIKQKYGVETIFFEDDITYKGLEKFVFELNDLINPKSILPVKTRIAAPLSTLDVQIDEDETARILELSKKQKNENQ